MTGNVYNLTTTSYKRCLFIVMQDVILECIADLHQCYRSSISILSITIRFFL